MSGPPDFSQMTDTQLDAWLASNQSRPQSVTVSPLPDLPGTNVAPKFGDFMNMSDDELAAYLANSDPTMSTLEDVGRSSVTGLQQGVAALTGGAGDLQNMWGQGVDWLARKGIDALQDTTGRSLGAPDMDTAPKVPPMDYAALTGAATSDDLNQAFAKNFGPYHDPQTTAGKYARTIAEFAPGAALGASSMLNRAGAALLGGTGAEAAGQLTEGKPYEGLARLVGGGAGLLALGGVNSLAASPQRLMANAIGDVPAGAQDQAIALMRTAEAQGIRLTPAEAIQQVTGGATGAGRLQRLIEGTQRGNEQLAPFFAQRPEQVRTAAMRYADAIAPPTPNPSIIGTEAQRSAQTGLDQVRQTINNQARPHYDALPGNLIPDADYATLAQNPSYQRALADLRGNAELNGPLAQLPDNDLSVVNEVVKQLDTNATAARQTVQNPAGNNRLAGLRGDARTEADQLAGAISGDWRAARDTVAQGRAQYLEPLEAGPAGAIARTDQVPQQTGALYPKNPLEGAPNETEQALRLMGQVNPQVGPDLTRQHLVNALNTASRDLSTGPNQYVGAKYANAIAGNPEQAATLERGVATVGGDVDGLQNLLESLRATGKRQAPGSMTAFNNADLEALSASLPGRSGSLTNPLTWGNMIGDGVKGLQYRRNVDSLAEALMMTPDEAAAFLQRGQQTRGTSAFLPAILTGQNP